MKLNRYKVRRNYSKKNGFFIVSLPEDDYFGVGFQLFISGTVYGLSITNK